jgi:mRNA interferase MazF
MTQLAFGDIVLLKFPFTDGNSFKKRPALIINDFNDGDIIVCRITSKIYNTNKDVFLDEWNRAGLKLASVVRVHKIATLEKELVEAHLGKITEAEKLRIKAILEKLTE